MKKIMFNDQFGLTEAVLNGSKTMTRRLISDSQVKESPNLYVLPTDNWYGRITSDGERILATKSSYEGWQRNNKNHVAGAIIKPRYQLGEIVAVAQAYSNAFHPLDWVNREIYEKDEGWNKKMFVRADLMPHQIRITDIKVERLQNISDDDCLREGIRPFYNDDGTLTYYFMKGDSICSSYFEKDAFADLIDAIIGKGTWAYNPWVFAYTFELVKKGGNQ